MPSLSFAFFVYFSVALFLIRPLGNAISYAPFPSLHPWLGGTWSLFFALQERNDRLVAKAAQLERQIKLLIDDSVVLLKARMSELGVVSHTPADLITKASCIPSSRGYLSVSIDSRRAPPGLGVDSVKRKPCR